VSGLIDAERLAARLGEPGLRVLDATVYLDFPADGGPPTATSGRAAYEEGHVPGAVFADLISDLSDTDTSLPFMRPTDDRFAAAIGALGVGDGDTVVVYDQGATMWATRLWWLLRYFGHEDVLVLDGGLPAWKAAGGALETGTETPAPATFTARARPELVATSDDVLEASADGATCVVNALDPELHAAGHIPGSVNLASSTLVDPETGRVRPVGELRETIGATVPEGGPPPIAYCGGGISATLDVFALALAGREDARLYDGSLVEWTSDPSRPVATG
jgi:thiosulfate/3-mercaptopyruvate sulfurtransferase